jgi:3-oxoacyl-[acyl-carrier protein] reductase
MTADERDRYLAIIASSKDYSLWRPNMRPVQIEALVVSFKINDLLMTIKQANNIIKRVNHMPKNRIDGKSAVVTGGTRGIGYAISEDLLQQGSRVLLCGTGQEGVDQAVHQLRAAHGKRVAGMVCNVRKYDQVQAMMLEAERIHGGLDILVNNAGIGRFVSVEKMAPEDWNATVETNLSGVFYCCHEAIPLMKKRGGGYIINIDSLAGKNFFPGGSAYSASKAGLIGFSEALMQEIRYDHIRVSYVMPGSVETEFGSSSARKASSTTWKLLAEDIAAVVLELLNSDPRSLSSRVEIRPSEPKKQ